MKKARALLIILICACLILTGCQNATPTEYAKKAYQTIRNCEKPKGSTLYFLAPYYLTAYYQKYENKEELAKFPDNDVWKLIPSAGYCFLFGYELNIYHPITREKSYAIAYCDVEGNVVYSFDAGIYYFSKNEAGSYYDLMQEAISKKQDYKYFAEWWNENLKNMEEYKDIVNFLNNQGASIAALDSGLVGGKKKYSAFSEGDIKTIVQ